MSRRPMARPIWEDDLSLSRWEWAKVVLGSVILALVILVLVALISLAPA